MADMVGVGDESAIVDRDSALADLHREHYDALVRLACLLVDDMGSGEEVVQDAFVRVYRAWPKVDQPIKYLRTAVINGSRSRLRRRRSARRYVPPTARAEPSAEDAVVRRFEQNAVMRSVRGLPRRQRECLVLRYYLDLSETEIAAALGISKGSVKSHSHRGLTALALGLEEDA